MANTVAGIHLLAATLETMPSAANVTIGTLCAAIDRNIVYRSDGTDWQIWLIGGDMGLFNPDTYVRRNADETLFEVHSGECRLGNVMIYNPNDEPVFLHVYDDDLTPSTNPLQSIPVPADGFLNKDFNGPLQFTTGMVMKITADEDPAVTADLDVDCVLNALWKEGLSG
jgi:hypothetical protein